MWLDVAKESSTTETDRRRLTAVCLILLVVLAAFLRVYRLSEQSVWIDEYSLLATLGAPDLGTYTKLFRLFSPDVVPLGFIAHYVWGQVVGTSSVPVLRLFSVIVSTACVPLIFLFARLLYGTRPALIAAACLALSPVHIRLGQATRPNALIEILALISVYALLRASREGALRWWILNLGANLLLVWTHPFTLFLVIAEGCFMLLSLRRRFRQTFTWGGLMLPILASPLLWLRRTLSYVPPPEEDFILQIPPLKNWVIDWIGDDAVMASDPFAFQGTTWGFLPPKLSHAFVSAHGWFDLAIMLFFAICVVWVCAKSVGAVWGAGRDEVAASARDHLHGLLLVLAIAFLPLAIMILLSHFWRPCILPRYTSYSSFGLYVIVGVAIGGLSRRGLRRAALAVLVLLYGYQLSLGLPAATRTDFLSAERHIRAYATPDDLILMKGTIVSWEVFRFNAGDMGIPMLPAYTLQAVCDKSALFVGQAGPPDPARVSGGAVWAVIEPFIYTLPPLDLFEACLSSHGLAHDHVFFPGMNGLHVYRITPDPAWQADGGEPPKDIVGVADYAGILEDMRITEPGQANYDAALSALRRVVDTEWPRTPWYYSFLAIHLTSEGYLDLGLAAARKAAESGPHHPFTHFALAVALGESGDAAGAAAALDAAIASDTIDYFRFYRPLFGALYEVQDYDTAGAELSELDAMGMLLPLAMRVRAGQVRVPEELKAAR